MRHRPGQQRPKKLEKPARLASAFCLWVAVLTATTLAGATLAASTVAVSAPPASAEAPSVASPSGPCAADPGQEECTITGISLSTSGLACTTSCDLNVGVTAELTIVAIYNDGSEGPLSVVAGNSGPQASFSTSPSPATAFTLSGVVNGADDVAEVQLTADGATTSPAVVEVTYDGFDASSPPVTAAVSPTCGAAGLPQCQEVNGALLTVSAVVTSTASDTPLAGAVADIVQAGPASGTGAFVSDQPCYTQDGDSTCGPVPAGDPATASAATCTTPATGSCPLTAMWDGSQEDFSSPDTVALYPPPGYAVTSVSGCAPVTGTGPALTCDLTVPDGSSPLAVVFGLEPVALLTVSLAGPLEPSEPGVVPGELSLSGPVYDNDAVDGTAVTVTPIGTPAGAEAGGTAGQPSTCLVQGGSPGGTGTGVDASCTLALAPGTYSVSLPGTISTPQSEVDIGLAYVTGENPQTVALGPGEDQDVSFASGYEPTITVALAGPLEPNEQDDVPGGVSGLGPIYDNDAVDGTTVTVAPAGGSAGTTASCQVEGGYPGDNVDYGEPASCSVNVPPGTYSVSVPSTIETPYSEVGVPLAYVTGADPQTVTVAAGADQDVNFASEYEPAVTVTLDGPLEPGCAPSNCSAEGPVYDNDAVDGVTATINPSGGSSGTQQTCQLEGGYPGDNTDYGQAASCTVGEPPGTYSVSLPSTIETPYSEVGIPLAYVTGQNPQSVTLSTGEDSTVKFTSAYEPTISVTLAGPLEPACTTGTCAPGAKVYDDDAVNGTTVTVKPTGATSGPATSCQVEGGEPDGTAGARQEASCDVGVAPGTYKVSVPAQIAPSPDYGWGYIDVKGADPRQVTVGSSGAGSVAFSTSYAAVDNVGSGPGSARTKDGLLTASGSGGTGTVTVGEYSSDPEGLPTFNKYSGTNDFFDVSVSSGSTFQKLVFTICGLAGNADAMSWWDTTAAGAKGGWAPVAPASSVASLKPGCLTATITGITSPAVTDLGGTVFAVALRLDAQRVSFTTAGPSRAVAGDSYKPLAAASSKLPVAYSIDPSSGMGACLLTSDGTVKFTGPGVCALDATQAGDSHWAAASVKRDITVLAGKPVADDASYSTPMGSVLRVAARKGVLAKDSVNDATISSHTSPAHGTLMLLGNGAFTYVPRPSFSGTDHFTYTLRNSLGHSTATISIEVGDLTRAGT